MTLKTALSAFMILGACAALNVSMATSPALAQESGSMIPDPNSDTLPPGAKVVPGYVDQFGLLHPGYVIVNGRKFMGVPKGAAGDPSSSSGGVSSPQSEAQDRAIAALEKATEENRRKQEESNQ